MISEELMSKVWEAYQGDPMDPKNNTEAGLRRVVEVVMGHALTPSTQTHLVGWMYEDELPKSYPYDAMFPHSKVEGVRMFPVYAPASRDDTGPLTVSYPDHMIAHNLLLAHTGSEGGNPAIDWYKLRGEISDAIAVALDNQRNLDTPPKTREVGNNS